MGLDRVVDAAGRSEISSLRRSETEIITVIESAKRPVMGTAKTFSMGLSVASGPIVTIYGVAIAITFTTLLTAINVFFAMVISITSNKGLIVYALERPLRPLKSRTTTAIKSQKAVAIVGIVEGQTLAGLAILCDSEVTTAFLHVMATMGVANNGISTCAGSGNGVVIDKIV